MTRKLPAGESEREFRRLASIETDECVIWPYAKAGQRGYGLVYFSGAKKYAHREALRLRVSQPDGQNVARHGPCNEPSCMNYRHLAWGTSADNNVDMRRDGTTLIGARNPMARLTEDQVRRIRTTYGLGGVSQREVAELFGVTTMTINRALSGESWNHVA